MKASRVRMTVEMAAGVSERLKRQAVAEGCTEGELILRGVEKVLAEAERKAGRRVKLPLIESTGRKVKLPPAKVYALIEFP